MQRIIQVGLGSMGQRWAELIAASPDWEAAAYVDPNRRRLLATAERFGMPRDRCFTSTGAALKRVEAEALLDVTPPQERQKVCAAAFDAGLDVLCEKPLGVPFASAQAVVEQAEEAGRLLMVAQNYRYQPLVHTARRFIEKDRLGQVGYACINFHRGPHFGGFREEMPYPLLLDMAIHHIDMLRALFNTDVTAVQGVSLSPSWSWFGGDAAAFAVIECANGMAASYTGSWVARGWETTWNGDWRIEGEKGVLMLEQDAIYFTTKGATRRKTPMLKFPHVQQEHLLRAFAHALRTGEEPETSGRRNLNSLGASHALVTAVKERRRVLVDELEA